MKKRILTLLIDLDNTLIDSNLAHEKSFKELLNQKCPQSSRAFNYSNFAGFSTVEILKNLDFPENEISKMAILKNRLYIDKIKRGEVNFFSDTCKDLTTLKKLNFQFILNTSASKMSVDAILQYMEWPLKFDLIIDSSTLSSSKNSYDYWVELPLHVGRDPNECLIVDDSLTVLRQAGQAGFNNLALFTKEKEFKKKFNQTLFTIHRLQDILKSYEYGAT